MTEMDRKIKTLDTILKNCVSGEYDLTNYDFTQPDSMDESDSGGVWDLAGDIVDNLFEICETDETELDIVDSVKTELQSLLYNLMCSYKTEQEQDE